MDYSNLFKKADRSGAEFSDLRKIKINSETISIENGNVNLLQKNTATQYGIRVFYKGAWGFSFGNDLKKIEKSFEHALKIAKISSKDVKEKFEIKNFGHNSGKIKVKGTSFIDVELEKKVKNMLDLDKLLDKKPIVTRSVASNFARKEQNYFNSFGANIEEEREYFGFIFTTVGKKGGQTRKIFDKKGMCVPYSEFQKIDLNKFLVEQTKKFPELFRAKKAPAGKFPIVVDNILAHVFFHEAVGHACEADAVLENSSVLKGKLNTKVAPNFLTLADDATILKEHGTFAYDDEGTKAEETILIKNGVLNSYLHSLETASRLNMKPTGNCRAENAISFPYPRMSNTVIYPGEYKVQELFEGIKKGIYAKSSTGGVVEPTNGNFLFNAKEAYLIENGKITKPLLDVSFGGSILEILTKIEKIANDSETIFGGWMCGKKAQSVPVGGKSPHLKISEAMVGGQND